MNVPFLNVKKKKLERLIPYHRRITYEQEMITSLYSTRKQCSFFDGLVSEGTPTVNGMNTLPTILEISDTVYMILYLSYQMSFQDGLEGS